MSEIQEKPESIEIPDGSVYAWVQLTLEIPLSQPWSAEEKIGIIDRMAREKAQKLITHAVHGKFGDKQMATLPLGTKIIGYPKVLKVVVASK